MTKQELQEALEHQNTLSNIRTVLNVGAGREFIKYLFNSFNVGHLPPVGMRGEDLIEFMSFLRAGNTIYRILLEAAPEITGQLITELEKGKQDVQNESNQNESSNGY